MFHKVIGLGSFVIVLTIALAILILPGTTALADCGGDASSCKSCHEGQAVMPVNTSGLWHTQHAFADFCANCHAGDVGASTLEEAHIGMHPVLTDPQRSCAECHADNYTVLATTYAQAKEGKSTGLLPAATAQLPPPGTRNAAFILINVALFAGLVGLFWAVESGPLAWLKRPRPDRPVAAPVPWNPLARKRWSPYWAGAGLGVVAVLALLLSQQPVGASGAFLAITSNLLMLSGSSLADSIYFKVVMPPAVTWQVLLVGGIVIGALLSAIWSKDFKLESVPNRWAQVFGQARWKRWAAMFAGGIILQYGASIAGGCTSGLAIAGSLQLSGAGFLFIGGLFGSGLLTARLLYGREY